VGQRLVNGDSFSDAQHRMVRSGDGSCTAYSAAYDEHYHSTKDGALTESLQKHVVPAFACFEHAPTLRILDICFGLGFNTLATLHYMREQGIGKRVEVVSPELDEVLVRSLASFEYPESFRPFLPIIEAISRTGRYEDENVKITVLFGDARKRLPTLTEPFDIVYQDAFSPEHNPALWTTEYFTELARLTHWRSVVTSYSTALKTRLALYENGFNVYLNKGEGFRNATVASKGELPLFEKVDMAHKIACNPDVKSLTDSELP
jgi:tRNA U34 5-methylaminomethyl-2-thiouridine-forming methyltransferase MnmC